MSVLRFFALVLIFGAVSVAWMVLGTSMWVRTEMLDDSLSREMNSLWGPEVLAQAAPFVASDAKAPREGGTAALAGSEITADIRHEHRYKGLLWYSTFTLKFEGKYTVPAAVPGDEAGAGRFFLFPLPRGVTAYDDLRIAVDDAAAAIRQADVAAGRIVATLDPAKEQVVTVNYVTTGRDVWLYTPGDPPDPGGRNEDRVFSSSGPPGELRDFSLTISTDFREIDYPKGTRSPSERAEPRDGGVTATWRYTNARTNQAMGIAVPNRPNAGPIVARMSFFAPVSLLFFFAVLFTVVVLRKIPLHPMHYLFIAAGFFAFHILMAYLADLIPIQPAFWVCAAVSVFLVVSYMRLVAGVKFAVLFVGLAQMVYLVGFSYAFFWAGRTGLAVTIGA
ncbi:MAG TPA: inner membrane CreD family protein, partial [Phycisphaerae bacterium]|nr:inner membrane CreD family protein [Phycisphaerae bacterium]